MKGVRHGNSVGHFDVQNFRSNYHLLVDEPSYCGSLGAKRYAELLSPSESDDVMISQRAILSSRRADSITSS